ncbi:MAG: FAD-dependent oxidoreductase [Candidatus Nanopelagicales bacterium]
MDHEVIVIGAGLAGLVAARRLAAAGVEVEVVEAADQVGGRVRTDQVDGYRVDRGFQVLNPAYPALRAEIDLARLDLHPFDRGVAVRRGDGLSVVSDPFRHPSTLLALRRSPWLDPRALAGLARWVFGGGRHDRGSVAASLDAAGVTGPLRTELIDPFLTGVLLEPSGDTAAAFARRMVRYFAVGTPSLPSQGMAALPALLAEPIASRIRLGTGVDALKRTRDGWRLDAVDGVRTARAVVVATDPRTAARLTSLAEVPMRGSYTWWFSAATPPSELAALHLHPGAGPVINTVVISNVASSYAPPGRHLVAATTLVEASEAEVRGQLAEIYDRPTADWEVVAHQAIPDSLPVVRSPRAAGQGSRLADGLHVAGDHRAHPSIQGALVAGRRAGAEVLTWLGRAGG